MLALNLPPPAHGNTRHLPGAGLAGSAVHEFRAPENTVSHAAFAVFLLAKLPADTPILWVGLDHDTYPPGLAWLGLNPARLLFAAAASDAESLGSLEVALRGGMAGVAEAKTLSRLAARRLGLAARQGGSIGFLLRHAAAQTSGDSTAFATRWMISPAPGGRLRAEILYAKGGAPGVFFYAMTEAEHDSPPALTLVSKRSELPRKISRAG